MKILRTPDQRFTNLSDFPYAPNYVEIPDGDGGQLQIHYVDEGSNPDQIILLMHGEPSWSYLYRKMIPILVEAGLRVIAPDLVGFGRSDKPANRNDYSYQRHVDWMNSFLRALNLTNVTLFGQDWGGLIGLRLVADQGERFAGVIAANTGLPTGDFKMSDEFMKWQKFSRETQKFPIGKFIADGCVTDLTPETIAAYDAPFPDESYKEGARIFPSLVPTSPDDPATIPNRQAWKALKQWEKPFLTLYSDSDPLTGGAERPFQKLIPGAKGLPHTIIEGAGHFLQEDKGEMLAELVVDFMK